MSGSAAGDDGWEAFPLVPRRRLRSLEHGSSRSLQRGLGSQIAGIRPYEPGDDVRRIDWPASARLSAARNADEFLVREHDADRAPRVVTIADRRSGMLLYPEPWLSKSDAVARVGRLIAQSASRERMLAGSLELRDRELVWEPPSARPGAERTVTEAVPGAELDRALELIGRERTIPGGSFVFVLSDFLAPLAEESIVVALSRSIDLVPVVIEDPIWEASFPAAVGGLILPLVDVASGKRAEVRVSKAEAEAQRTANEARHSELLERLVRLGLDPISLGTAEPAGVLQAFMEWATDRLAREWRAA